MKLKGRRGLIAAAKVFAAVLVTAFAFAFLMGTSCGVPDEPKTEEDWYKKGSYYAKDDKFGKAIDCFSKAISINPEFAKAYSYRGFCYFWMVQYEEALADFEKALELGVDHPEEIYFYIGRTYFKMANYEEAVISFTNAIEINKEIAEYYYRRGASYYNLNLIDKAEKDYREACALGEYDGCIRAEDMYEYRMEKIKEEKK